ncbi:MAG: hypothetical protein HQ518_10890 [Rhodopirellula sp.]|nr:hypothetical protein [Rhodopirellula sp.]
MFEYEDGQVGHVPPTAMPPGIGPFIQKVDGQFPVGHDWQAPYDDVGEPVLQLQPLPDETPGTAGL